MADCHLSVSECTYAIVKNLGLLERFFGQFERQVGTNAASGTIWNLSGGDDGRASF
jgi:hypothetical protein